MAAGVFVSWMIFGGPSALWSPSRPLKSSPDSLGSAPEATIAAAGREVAVESRGGRLHGTVTGLSPEGALLVRDSQGQTHTVLSGDARLTRPTPRQEGPR